MLSEHFAALEGTLIAQSKISGNAGHPNHVGGPREHFATNFLTSHLARTVDIGNGEIIAHNSEPKEKRNQHDIVVHYRDYPRLHFAADTYAFLVESVVATIEVKSKLVKDEFFVAMDAARAVKNLPSLPFTGQRFGLQPPSIKNFLVAYEGPASMKTACGWIGEYLVDRRVVTSHKSTLWAENSRMIAPGLDGVFVLGKGWLMFENNRSTLWHEHVPNPRAKWTFADAERGSLQSLFLFLTESVAVKFGTTQLLPYLGGIDIKLAEQYEEPDIP